MPGRSVRLGLVGGFESDRIAASGREPPSGRFRPEPRACFVGDVVQVARKRFFGGVGAERKDDGDRDSMLRWEAEEAWMTAC